MSSRWAWGLVLLVMGAVVIARAVPTPRSIDDSFITFRYSRNIIEGQGFVYNPGVQTLGTTTPLFTLVMAGVATAAGGQDFPWYALWVNTAADAINAALLFYLVYRVTRSLYPAVVIGLLWAVLPRSVTFAVGGMETSVNILWMLAAYTAFLHGRRTWVGVFAGLGLLTRPDAALWILPLGVYQLVEHLRERQIPWQTYLAGLLTLAPWVVFATAYFGSPLPNSLGAKSVAYIVPGADALVGLLQVYATPFMEFDTFGVLGIQVGFVLYPLLNALAVVYLWGRDRRLAAFLAYPLVYFGVFAVAAPLMFRWYYTPPLPAWIFGIVIGAWSLVEIVGKRTNTRVLYPVAGALMLGVWGGVALNHWQVTPTHGPQSPAPEMAWHDIELQYEEIGRQLREEFGATAETRVASADIGAVGYFSGATIIDTVGLVTPALSAYYPFDRELLVGGQNYAVPPALILETQPDYFVTPEAFVRLGLAQMPEFTENYTLVREIPFEVYGTGIQLYARDGVATSDGQ